MPSRISRLMQNKPRLLLFAALLATLCINYHHLFLDFWFDEVWSLRDFQVVPLKTTLTDYSDVNNHIGFNLLCNLYLKATGQHSLITVLMHPARLRIITLLVPLGTVWALWKLSMEISGIRLALINIVLLLTALPFYNFTMQLRGYGLAIMLVLVILLYLYHYQQTMYWRNALGVALFLTLLIYVHPANIYFTLALYPAVALLAFLNKDWNTGRKKRFVIQLFAAITIGAIAGLLLYAPMAEQLFFNKLSGLKKHLFWGFFKHALLFNTIQFISWQYVALLAGIAGFYLVIVRRRPSQPGQTAFFWSLIILYLVPYIISFLRKDMMVVRIFVPLNGVFIMALGMSINWLLEQLPERIIQSTLTGILASCMIIFPVTLWYRNVTIDENNLARRHPESLTSNYYSHNFYAATMFRLLLPYTSRKDFLLFCIHRQSLETYQYLNIAKIKFHRIHEIKYVLGDHRMWWLYSTDTGYLRTAYPDWKFKKLNKGEYCPNLYQVTR